MMNFRYLLAVCVCINFTACTEKTPVDVINDRLVKNSDGRYRLEYGDTSCRADYYINGQHYLDVPKLENGLYLYYENSAKYPILDFLDNREGRSVAKGLPIRDVRSISIRKKVVVVKTGRSQYLVETSNDGVPIVRSEPVRENSKTGFDRKLQFAPVEWTSGSHQNFSNDFISMADTSIENYRPGATPRIVCIRSLALYSQPKEEGQAKSEFGYLIGETAYSPFTLSVETGEVRYIARSEFIEMLHSAGVSSLVTSVDYYMREKKLDKLSYRSTYKELGSQTGQHHNSFRN